MKLNKFFLKLEEDPALKNLKGQKHYQFLNYFLRFLKNPFKVFKLIKKLFIFIISVYDYLNTCKTIKSRNIKKNEKKYFGVSARSSISIYPNMEYHL